MWDEGIEILDCLKRKRDISVKKVKPSQNTAFMRIPALNNCKYELINGVNKVCCVVVQFPSNVRFHSGRATLTNLVLCTLRIEVICTGSVTLNKFSSLENNFDFHLQSEALTVVLSVTHSVLWHKFLSPSFITLFNTCLAVKI